ncbi:MAG: hypothetical protein JWL85_223 [Candidatus Saccharibacteria bacterium]|nr:hypothetical protein [Candidatus Saccharibacteria bacterium]
MLLSQFLAQNVHFTISLFASLILFAVFWLVFDAWTVRKEKKELVKWVGFLFLSIGFLLYAAVIEQASFGTTAWADELHTTSSILRLIGYGLLIAGQLMDPLMERPKTTGIQPNEPVSATKPAQAAGIGFFGNITSILIPFAAFGVAVLYWRRATTGLERHLKPIAISFALFTLFELFALGKLGENTANPNFYNWFVPFGYLWWAAHVVLLVSTISLGRWVWQYLVKRFQSQLFMVFTTMSVAIFAITTSTFTLLLMRNVEREAFTNMNTAGQVLNYAIQSRGAETLANAESLSKSSTLASSVSAADRKQIISLLGNSLVDKGLSSLVITSNEGQILVRGEDTESWGQSISDDPLVRRALLGESSSSAATKSGVIAPIVVLRAISPVRDASNNIVGTVIAERRIDNGFVDGIKQATGLESAVYADNVRSSTTLVAPDGRSRWIGAKETNSAVRQTVLERGQTYTGSLFILNRAYLVAYLPLKDANNTVIGMVSIAQPRITLLSTVAQTVQLTFILVIFLILLMVLPALWMARRIANQIR